MRTGRPDLDARLRVSEMPEDEPWFVLRGQDACADEAVRHYAQVVIARGGPVALAERALQQADAMSNWRVRKMPDIDLPEAERKNLEYQHSRRGMVRSGELPVSHAYEQGVADERARQRSSAPSLQAATREYDRAHAAASADDEALQQLLLQAAGALATTAAPGLGAAVIVAAGRLFPSLADFRPRLLLAPSEVEAA